MVLCFSLPKSEFKSNERDAPRTPLLDAIPMVARFLILAARDLVGVADISENNSGLAAEFIPTTTFIFIALMRRNTKIHHYWQKQDF